MGTVIERRGWITAALMATRSICKLWSLAIVLAVSNGCLEQQPHDLTGADLDEFESSLNKIVTINGRLETGKHGYTLLESTPREVVFYVTPRLPPNGGSYSYPESWQELLRQRVCLTGKLLFQRYPEVNGGDETTARPVDHFYMVLQDTRIQPAE